MDPSRLAAIDSLFEEALDLPAEARAALLDRRAAGDPELRAEVEALLVRSGQSVASLLDPVRAYAAAIGPGADELAPGETVGAYRLVRSLGEGGMGIVYLAERIDGTFERQVALKLLPAAGPAGARSIERFEQERQILARLAHPGIAHLLDGGVDRRGLPYLVMEHVDGLPIDRWCDERQLPLAERIRLVIEIAEAVQAAHRNLVVHRDIKPSNVLVDASGRVKLLDFGIAKLLDDERPGGGLTRTEAQALTPTYASPEQVNGEAITTAVDIYQLGLLLYELATGHRPQESRSSSLADLVELVCRHEPAPPSRVVLAATGEASPEELAALRRSTPSKLARQLRPELDAIVSRALAKDPERRYTTPAELAADLERFLEGRPVQARRPSLAFRARRWMARNAALAAVGAVAVLALAGYAVTVTLQSRAIDRQRLRAEREAATASAVERFLVGLFGASDPETASAREVTARELLESGAGRIETELAGQPAVQARLWSALGQIQDNLGAGESAREMLRRALALQVSEADNRIDLAETQRRLGVALRRHGDRAEARSYLAESVNGLRATLTADDPRLATALAELGFAKALLGEWESGEADLRESLEIRRHCGARAEIADTLNDLGLVLQLRGDAPGSETYFREALAIFRDLHGDRHVKVANALANLGQSRRAVRDFDQALRLFTEATTINRAFFGDRHPEVGNNLAQLAMVNQQIGNLERSEELYGQSLAILEPQLTPDHPQLLAVRQGMGALRVKQERFPEAEELLRQAVVEWRKKPKSSYQGTRRAFLWLGRSLEGQGRMDEAIAAWQEGLAISPGMEDELTERLRSDLAAAGAPAEAPAQAGVGDSSAR